MPVEDSPTLARRAADGLRSGLTGHAMVALRAGSMVLLRRGWDAVAPRLSVGERWAAGAGAGYVVVYTVPHAHLGPAGPFIAPGVMLVWCVAAWIVSPPPTAPESAAVAQPAAEPEEEGDGFESVAALIRKVAAANKHKGVHLADLIATPELDGWEQAELKAALVSDWGVPVEEIKLRFNGKQRVRDGVRLRDLPPPPAPEAPLSTPAEGPVGPPPEAPVDGPSEGANSPSPTLLPTPTPGAR